MKKGKQRANTKEIAEHPFCAEPVETNPIPIRPAGYFARTYRKSEIAIDNQLAKASVVRAPTDLE
jgi:hypothetical protein